MSRKFLRLIVIFFLAGAGAIFADQILWPLLVERPFFYKYKLEQSPVYVIERKEVVVQENAAITSAIEKAEKTVVGVRAKTSAGDILEGSGLIITSDGLLVTLATLIPKGSSFFSFLIDGKPVSYQILKRDLENDLALIKIDEANLTTAGFADSAKVKLGERVFLVGRKTVNEGIVRSFNEDLIETNIFEKNNLSGTPLFNIEGNVLGLNIVGSEGKISAIPSVKLKQFIGF